MIAVLFAAAALMMAEPTAATAQPATTPTPVSGVSINAKKDDPDRMICKQEAEIGTRFTKKVCRRAGDIKDRQLQDRMDLERNQGTQNLPH